MSASTAPTLTRPSGSPLVTLRLLAMADEVRCAPTEEPEQLVLPLEWAWSIPKRREEEPKPPAERADPKQWGARMTLAAFEIMLGRRPAGQLARIVDSRTLHTLAVHTNRYAAARRLKRTGTQMRPRLTSIRCYQPHPDAAEITAVVHDGERIRAVAMRMNARGTQWLTTAFEIG